MSARRLAAAWFEDGLAELAAAVILAGLSLIFSIAPRLPAGSASVVAGAWILVAIPIAGRWVQRRKIDHTAPRTGWVSFERRRPVDTAVVSLLALGVVLLMAQSGRGNPPAIVAGLWAIASAVAAWRTGLRRFQLAAAVAVLCAIQLELAPLPLFAGLAMATGVLAAGAAILGGGARARYLHRHQEAA